MSWREGYDAKSITADEAVSYIQKGDRISCGHATGEPQLVTEAMVRNQEKLDDVVLIHGIAMGPSLYCREEVDPRHIKHETFFAGAKTRNAINDGRANFVPFHFSDAPSAYRNGTIPITVAILHVSEPDRYGFCSFGISIDYERAAVDAARLVIAEVNSKMPRTYGDSLIHVSEIDYFVKSDRELHVMAKPPIGPVEEALGENIAGLVHDGCCLQLGMGAVPNAIMSFLTEKNDLGLHTELISDGAMELMKAGNITNRYKSINKGKSVATFASGTRDFYEWLDANPMVEFYPVNYINNSHVISQNDNVFSVNSAIQIDLMGQVYAETIKGKQFSGIGGQMDFVRGATWSNGGKSIIAMSATAKNGAISKIVVCGQPADVVSTPRNDVDYVVTEFGVAHLRGQHITERARRLIAVADPRFTEELKGDFERVYGLKL